MVVSEEQKNVCPLCGASSITPYFDTDARLCKCIACNVGFLDRSLWIEDLHTYYESNESYSGNSFDEERVSIMRRAAVDLLKIMSRFITVPVGKMLLDIGSNYGIFLDTAKQAGYQVSGVEMNKKLAEQAKERGLMVTQGAALDIDSTATYDVVTMIHVLEHISDVQTMLAKVHTALKRGAHFFVEVQNIESSIAKKHKESWKYVSLEHLYYFTPPTLKKLLEDAGFTVISIIPRNHYLETFSITYLLQYLFPTKQKRDRFFKKGEISNDPVKSTPKQHPFFKRLLRSVLIFLIRILRRQDLMLIVAQKTK